MFLFLLNELLDFVAKVRDLLFGNFDTVLSVCYLDMIIHL